MKRLLYILPIILLICSSCFEKEDIIIPREIVEYDIPYSLYDYQTYFRLSEKQLVAFNYFSDWDLGFESSSDGYHIILNPSRFMLAGKAGSSDFESVLTNTSDTLVFDNSSGDLNQTALRTWADYSDPQNPVFSGEVFIIDRGLDELGQSYGFKKLLIEKLEGGSYFIRYANLDGSEEYSFQITKDPDYNFVLFSFENGGKLSTQQPMANDWDLCFTKYSTIILDDYGVPTPYLVRGVFINNISGVKASLDTLNNYYNIDSNYIPAYDFSNEQDAIGYEWKVYDNETYTLIDGMNYIIEDQSGIIYKLRFTDYFDDAGQKGYPSFELSQISL